MNMYIDFPLSHPLYSKVEQHIRSVKLSVTDRVEEADFVIRPLGWPTSFEPQKTIYIGDFSIPQVVPTGAICVNIKNGMVQMPRGNIHWKQYVLEGFLMVLV